MRKWEVDASSGDADGLFDYSTNSEKLDNLHLSISKDRKRVQNLEMLLATFLNEVVKENKTSSPSTSAAAAEDPPARATRASAASAAPAASAGATGQPSMLNKLKEAAKNFLRKDIDEASTSGSSRRTVADLDEDEPLSNVRQKAPSVYSAGEDDDSLAAPTTKIKVYLEKLSLEFNASDLDHFGSDCSQEHAMIDFVRTNSANQFFGTLFSNAISYDKYLNGYYLVGYDLTASHNGGK